MEGQRRNFPAIRPPACGIVPAVKILAYSMTRGISKTQNIPEDAVDHGAAHYFMYDLDVRRRQCSLPCGFPKRGENLRYKNSVLPGTSCFL